MCNELTAHSAAVQDFLGTDPEEMVLKSGASFSQDHKHIIIKYFGQKHFVHVTNAKVINSDNQEVPYNDATLILQYLKQCSGLPPRNKWISFLELPDGIHHNVPFIKNACEPLGEVFGYCSEQFKKIAEDDFGGVPIKIGDIALSIPAFPKLPLAVAIWEGDDEFPARATILFDSIAPHQLTTAALWVLGCELTKKLVSRYTGV